MPAITQQNIDDLAQEARMLAPSGKTADLDADIKSRVHQPLETQARFLRRVIDAFETTDITKYLPEPPKGSANSNGTRKPDASNPFSAAGWNKTEQARLVTRLGQEKAEGFAKAAGVTLGSTKPNPLYN
jgi:hypothetical protein